MCLNCLELLSTQDIRGGVFGHVTSLYVISSMSIGSTIRINK